MALISEAFGVIDVLAREVNAGIEVAGTTPVNRATGSGVPPVDEVLRVAALLRPPSPNHI